MVAKEENIMSSLLNKTRMLNKILQKSGTEPVAFSRYMCPIK